MNLVEIQYQIYPDLTRTVNVHDIILRPDLIHAPGEALFVTIHNLPRKGHHHVQVKWLNVPSGWHVLSSHEMKSQIDLNLQGEDDDVRAAFYILGKTRLYIILLDKHPVYLSLYGNFDFTDVEIKKMVKQIISSQRRFFNDSDFPFYLMSLVEGNNPSSIGGTKLMNSFAAYLHTGLTRLDFYILFAHEHLHNWIGGKIQNEHKEEALHYWWSEGFTEY